MNLNRRTFIKLSSASVAGALLGANSAVFAQARKPPIGRVVVIGGGYAGATAAKYLRLWSLGSIEVIVVEANTQFVSCPLSNLVLGGHKKIDDLTFGYDALKKNHGIGWVNDTVTALDVEAKKVILKRGELKYDRLIIAPGIDFMFETLPMLQTVEAQQKIPHAWKAGKHHQFHIGWVTTNPCEIVE